MFHFAHQGKRIRVRLTREEFEALTADILDRTRLTVNKLLREAKTTWDDITRLLLVGGSTRMPMVQRMLEKESGKKVDRSLSPDEAVAHGAAIYAGILLKKGIPTIQGISVRNVNSHALGILGVDPKTKRRRRKVMIPRNTQLPVNRSCVFPTNKHGQKSVLVHVVEGGTDSGANATDIGKCTVTDLPPDLPKRTPVKVSFRYAANGRLKVYAELPTIQRKASLTIQRASGLSKDDLAEWRKRIKEGRLLSTSSIPTPAKSPVMEMTEVIEEEDELDDVLDLALDNEEVDELDLSLDDDGEGGGEAEPAGDDEMADAFEPVDDGLMPDLGSDLGLAEDEEELGLLKDDEDDRLGLKEIE
jgi:molecular chaperone DnaK